MEADLDIENLCKNTLIKISWLSNKALCLKCCLGLLIILKKIVILEISKNWFLLDANNAWHT